MLCHVLSSCAYLEPECEMLHILRDFVLLILMAHFTMSQNSATPTHFRIVWSPRIITNKGNVTHVMKANNGRDATRRYGALSCATLCYLRSVVSLCQYCALLSWPGFSCASFQCSARRALAIVPWRRELEAWHRWRTTSARLCRAGSTDPTKSPRWRWGTWAMRKSFRISTLR